ncbi:MAG: hypothetical protein ACYTG0_44155 [Planctomycetota bacterium]|jgi:hypothetical protein
MQRVCQASTSQLEQTVALPQGVRLDFDAAREEQGLGTTSDELLASQVLKTSQRTVISLQQGRFEAREIVRRQPGEDGESSPVIQRSMQLAGLVPPSSRYGFDLIAHVGVESYLRGHSLQEIRRDLANRQSSINIPKSSLWDQQQKFLFYLGHLHEQAADPIRQYLAEQGKATWLLDGTVEPGTSVFLGIEDAGSGLLLGGWKIPSENVDDIAPCLRQAAHRFGQPARVLHDLSSAMSGACDEAFPAVPHYVCHYHLCRDVGGDLYEQPQAALCKRLRSLKVQLRLREQRAGQTQWLRRVTDSQAEFVLAELLAGRPVEVSFSHTLGREVLLAFHYWILDYRGDGRRRGFPFDPYLLYLHRRLVRAGEAVDRLLDNDAVAQQAQTVLFNFQKQLQQYRHDEQIVAATELYERACAMFDRLRQALRLSAEHMDNLREPHELPAGEQQEIKTALDDLRQQLQLQSQDQTDIDQPLAKIVLKHLDKYWTHLLPDPPPTAGERWKRTTNDLEREWGGLKRVRRRAHGRGKLSRDFQALPEEYLLIANLENPVYVELVLGGSLESLPSKLAQASGQAGSFDAWRRRHQPRLVGQLSRRLLREDDFIDHLIQACQHHCSSHKTAA